MFLYLWKINRLERLKFSVILVCQTTCYRSHNFIRSFSPNMSQVHLLDQKAYWRIKENVPLFVEERDIQCHTNMTKYMLQHNRSNFSKAFSKTRAKFICKTKRHTGELQIFLFFCLWKKKTSSVILYVKEHVTA